MTTLKLTGNHLGDAGTAALAASPHLANLTTLNLKYNGIGDEGAQALAASPHLLRLERLALDNNPITPDVRATVTQVMDAHRARRP